MSVWYSSAPLSKSLNNPTVTHDFRPHARAAYLGPSTTSTVGNRGALSTFQLTCNTSTDRKNNNKKKKLWSSLVRHRFTPSVSPPPFFFFFLITVPSKEENAVVLLWKCRRFRISRRPVTAEGDRLVFPGRRRSRSFGRIWL